MRPTEVVALQADAAQRFASNDVFRRYTSAVLSGSWSIDPSAAGLLSKHIGQSFKNGETYLVTSDMTDLVEFAASRLDGSDKIDVTMFPAPWGVVRFERPLLLLDLRGVELRVHWMTWGPSYEAARTNAFGQTVTRKSIVVSWWSDTSDPDPVWVARLRDSRINPKALRQLGRWSLIGADEIQDGRAIGPTEVTLTDAAIVKAEQLTQEIEDMGITAPSVNPEAPVTNTIRWAWALMLLLNQEISAKERPRYSKADMKFLRRLPVWNQVTVVTLRRKAHRRGEGESRVDWAHRWLVRGHWRWQPYSDGTVQRIWINAFVKGPEDKPFIQTKTVNRLSR